ncbi:Carboxylesterase, partial [Blyttiomyces helicus]
MKRQILFLPLSVLLSLANGGPIEYPAANPTVVTALGTIEGTVCPGFPTVAQYQGIPFAQPPIGPLRWKPPLPFVTKYPNGILNASAPGPECPQVQSPFSFPFPQSEDCLYLNVYTPLAKSNTLLPVRVWVYGGAFVQGAGADYVGCPSVSATDTILVTFNYRLGALGFLAHPALFARDLTTGNYGTQDVQAALRWVQANIKAFGGDPSKVLLHGESAGATAVFLHFGIPTSAGLFSAIAAESG